MPASVRSNDGAAAEYLPSRRTLPVLAAAVQECRGCDLYRHTVHAVFGEGAPDASLVIVGEQPGDAEDRAGRPFVGPAGRVLDEALAAAHIPRDEVYVTNAVKHFKFTASQRPGRGKQRLHAKPTVGETRACRPWLVAELELLRPRVLVILGATAALSLLGRDFKLMKQRGEIVASSFAPVTIATLHPAAILRAPSADAREASRALLFGDLAKVASLRHSH
jgi:DNA polymerase